MGRVHERNPRYRTKDEIVHDITYVLNSPLSYGTKWAVLRDACWVWTEYHGKYNGCPYWTKMAILQHQLNPKSKFRHEHAVPKSVVIEMLFNLKNPTIEQVANICQGYLIGVVVSLEEDSVLNVEFGKTMPKEFFDQGHPDFGDPWIRYKRYKIEVTAVNIVNVKEV